MRAAFVVIRYSQVVTLDSPRNPLEGPIGREERVLGHVLRVLVVAHHPVGNVVDEAGVLFDEGVEVGGA
jgi:hypothetical protein